MENENNENLDSQIETEEAETSNDEFENNSEENEDLEARVRQETASLYARAKKAEAEAKELKAKLANNSQTNTSNSSDLSNKDVYLLLDAKVPYEDFDVVQKYAKLEGISIAEALKDNIVKGILSNKAEMRQTAKLSNTGNSKRNTGKLSEDALVENALKGNLPENEDDIMRLVQARNKK